MALEQIDNGDKTLEDLGLSEYKGFYNEGIWIINRFNNAGVFEKRNIVFGIFENGEFGIIK